IHQTRATWHPTKLGPKDLWDKLDRVLWHQDEPFNSCNILICFDIAQQAAASGVRVLLNGGGADEPIGGYFADFPNYWLSLLHAGKPEKTRSEIDAYCAVH